MEGRSSIPEADLQAMIGQMIMVGFQEATVERKTPIVRALRELSLGGVILYNIDLKCYLKQLKRTPGLGRWEASRVCPRNILSPAQVRTLTADLKFHAPLTPFIAVDQEGGVVSRLGPWAGFSESPSPKELGERDDLKATEAAARAMAVDLKAAGINLNLAPVVDLSLNQENIIAKNGRSFGPDPNLVCRHARAFIQVHRGEGLLTTLKHFPGKGSAGKDTHYDLADVTDCYAPQELEPFSRLTAEGLADLIMTAHIYNARWDRQYPATLSLRVLTGTLREDLNYRGIIISDDLLMGAIGRRFRFEEACLLAIQAGVDVLLASNNSPEGCDPKLPFRMFSTIHRAVKEGRISIERIKESYQRIMGLKKIAGLI